MKFSQTLLDVKSTSLFRTGFSGCLNGNLQTLKNLNSIKVTLFLWALWFFVFFLIANFLVSIIGKYVQTTRVCFCFAVASTINLFQI
jgi:hypothetical protein